jgi:hypothetical protein
MKILFVASNPVVRKRLAEMQALAGPAEEPNAESQGYSSLELEREITELQRRLLFESQGGTLELRMLPQLSVHDLSRAIDSFKPDILHVSAHGSEDSIILSGDKEQERPLKVEQFIEILEGVEQKPRLIFVSACKSNDIAKKLKTVVDFSIGTKGSISIAAARGAAVKFYELLAKGYPVRRAFNAARAIVRIEDIGIDLLIFERLDGDAEHITLAEPLRLLAAFSAVEQTKHDPGQTRQVDLSKESGELEIELGIAGCPGDVRQACLSA